MKKILAIALAVIMAVCCLPVIADQRVDVPTKEGIGLNINGFSTTDLTGNPCDDSILQNAELTFINYWATWCGPCVGEMPHIKEMHQYYSATPEADVQFIGVISEGSGCTPQTAQNFLNQNGYTWTNLRADSVLNAVFRTSGYIPQTIVVDRNGVVRDHWVGSFSNATQLRQFIEMWLEAFRNEGEECNITYVNGVTGEVIATDTTPYGYPVDMNNYPDVPEMEGYEFKEWVASGEIYEAGYETIVPMAMGDVTFTATYEAEKHKVKFYDGVTGNLLNVQMVQHGEAANAPTHPEHEGYIFQGWDTDFSNVTEPLTITGICIPEGGEIPTPPPSTDELPGDVDGDDALSVSDATIIARMALGLEETLPVGDYDGNGEVSVSDATQVMRAALGLE